MSKRKFEQNDDDDDDNYSNVSEYTMDDLTPGYIRFENFTYKDLLHITIPIPLRYLNDMTPGSEIDEIVFYDLNRTYIRKKLEKLNVITAIHFEIVKVKKLYSDIFEITYPNRLPIQAKLIPIDQTTEPFHKGYDCYFKTTTGEREFHLRKIDNDENLRKKLEGQRHRRLYDHIRYGGIKKRKTIGKRKSVRKIKKKTYKNKKKSTKKR